MGKKKKAGIKVVLDTNVIVSAILFKGRISKLVELWKGGRIVPVVSPATYAELLHVLSYPKFSLSNVEIEMLLEHEVLPFISVVKETVTVNGICNDPDDDKFLSCALSSSAKLLITGDKDLAAVGKYRSIKILSASDFLKKFR